MLRKLVAVTVVTAALAAAPLSGASAHEHHGGDLALGLLGAAAVAGTVAALAAPPQPVVVAQPAPVYAYPPPAVVYAPAPVYAAPPVVYAPPAAYYPYGRPVYYYRRY